MIRRVSRRAPTRALVACLVLAAASASAHIVYGRPTLLGLVSGAERVAHVRVIDPAARAALPDGGARPVVEVELREVLKGGGSAGERLRFASHGHGVADYAAGEEVLVFLSPIDRSRELDVLRTAGIAWISFQEHDARYALSPAAREPLLAAVRAYVAAGATPGPRERVEALRGVTKRLVLGGPERLALGAVQDFAASADALPLLAREDATELVERGVRAADRPLGVRLGLLAELDRRGWVEGAPLWIELLGATRGAERERVIAAAGRHPSPEVSAALVALLGDADAATAEAAALALASPAHAGAAPALADALERPEPRVRGAAIRALGAIGTPRSRAALEAAAAESEDADLRRRAEAELRKRERP